MSPVETWAFVLVMFGILLSATLGAGRVWDKVLDRLFLRPERATRPGGDVECPCIHDRDYHRRMGRVWE